jgi:hypothetical protein
VLRWRGYGKNKTGSLRNDDYEKGVEEGRNARRKNKKSDIVNSLATSKRTTPGSAGPLQTSDAHHQLERFVLLT